MLNIHLLTNLLLVYMKNGYISNIDHIE